MYDTFQGLCRARGLSPNAVARSLDFSSGSLTAWKNGTLPRAESLIKIADFFNVSIDYLLGRTPRGGDLMPYPHFTPTPGEIYRNHSSTYLCVRLVTDYSAVFRNTISGWTFTAYDIYQDGDGSIFWAFSAGGYFDDR